MPCDPGTAKPQRSPKKKLIAFQIDASHTLSPIQNGFVRAAPDSIAYRPGVLSEVKSISRNSPSRVLIDETGFVSTTVRVPLSPRRRTLKSLPANALAIAVFDDAAS